ncbi:MAG TPA: DHH family phosphoesterase, partial [Prolixibacteraceae bacterium]|nr:DHH family phosphoesterase [Prolixibacteraceae bacterium]
MKNTENEIIRSLKRLLEKKQGKIVVIPHENPDGDAIGSAVGFAEVLNNQGHQVTIISPNNYPEFIKWFATEVEILIYSKDKKKAKRTIEEAEIMVCVDFNEPKRAGKLEKHILNFEGPKALIDHHPHPSDFSDYKISEPQYSSTAELIFDIFKEMDWTTELNKCAAEALYTGIMTDTGSFSHNIKNPNTFKVIASLVELGIDTDKIQSNVYHNFSANRMKLLGHCLNNKMEVFPEFRTAFISISKKELEDFDYQ